jgi:hypothetical protein
MSVLKNLEAKLGGLVEGAFSRAFKSRVEPVELARKLAKEMEDSKTVSVSRTYVPNHYRVFLSAQDREQFSSYEPALRKELSDYLLEHARAERLALTSRPAVEFMTDDRLGLGEFGIQAQLLDADEESEERPAAPSQGDFGHTMVYSPDRGARRLEPEPAAPSRAVLAGGGRRTVLSGERMVLGRSRDCDITLEDANVSREHAEVRPAKDGWQIVDLNSTNGVRVNKRKVDRAQLKHGDQITIGVTNLDFELE